MSKLEPLVTLASTPRVVVFELEFLAKCQAICWLSLCIRYFGKIQNIIYIYWFFYNQFFWLSTIRKCRPILTWVIIFFINILNVLACAELGRLSMEFNRIRLKEAIVMWPDMHSFLEFNKFEPISNSLRKIDHVLRFSDLTNFNCSSFLEFNRFGVFLARIC